MDVPSVPGGITKMKKKLDYEQSMTRLEEIVGLLESGELPLEESMKLFEEGTKLSQACYEILKNAEQKLTTVSAADGEEDGE